MGSILGKLQKAFADANRTGPYELRDFTTSRRVIFISIVATCIGTLGAFVALALLWADRTLYKPPFLLSRSTTLISPVGNTLGALVILVPVIGAMIVGLMARYGSERIRGHGIPEAIEAILD